MKKKLVSQSVLRNICFEVMGGNNMVDTIDLIKQYERELHVITPFTKKESQEPKKLARNVGA